MTGQPPTITLTEQIELERSVIVRSAFDKRHDDPKKDYGIGAVLICFAVKGPKGVIDFTLSTNWYLPSVKQTGPGWESPRKPVDGWSVNYHSPIPLFDGQELTTSTCSLLGGAQCYGDGSFLRADDWVTHLIAGGTDWLWPHMEAEYRHRFEDGPEVTP